MTRVAILGLGGMGRAFATCLVGAGLDVQGWNRTAGRAPQIAGLVQHERIADAIAGADVIITIASDGPAVADIAGELEDAAGATWLQMSTVGEADTELFSQRAAELGLGFVDVPVIGAPEVAAAGALVLLASADEPPRGVAVDAVLNALGDRTMWLGPVGSGTRMKVVVNSWILGCLAVLAETIALAEEGGLQYEHFLGAVGEGELNAMYTRVLGGAMAERDFAVRFPIALAAKDLALAVESTPQLPAIVFRAARDLCLRTVDREGADADVTTLVLAASAAPTATQRNA